MCIRLASNDFDDNDDDDHDDDSYGGAEQYIFHLLWLGLFFKQYPKQGFWKGHPL